MYLLKLFLILALKPDLNSFLFGALVYSGRLLI